MPTISPLFGPSKTRETPPEPEKPEPVPQFVDGIPKTPSIRNAPGIPEPSEFARERG